MRKVRRPLLVMHPDRLFHQRIRGASDSEYRFQEIPDWASLREAIRGASPVPLVVVDPYMMPDGRGEAEGPSPELRSLLTDFPSTAVVAAMEVIPSRVDDVRQLGEWGIAQVISIDHDKTDFAIRERLCAARGRSLRTLLDEILPADTPVRTRALMQAAADVVAGGGRNRDLAFSLYVSGRTLARWCAHMGLPPPRQLLAWMRVLLAAELLDDPGRRVLDVAWVCGYSCDVGLRRTLHGFLGETPTELRETGAFDRASRTFLELLSASRMAGNGGPR